MTWLLPPPPVLDELERFIHYPRLQENNNLLEEIIDQFLQLIRGRAIMVEPTVNISTIEDDHSDNRYLECAVAGGASFIATGDKHLLKLEEYEGIVMLPPSGFLALFELRD